MNLELQDGEERYPEGHELRGRRDRQRAERTDRRSPEMNAENDMTHGNDLAAMIVEKALDSGYDNCGIIPIVAIDVYADKLAERNAKIESGASSLSKGQKI